MKIRRKLKNELLVKYYFFTTLFLFNQNITTKLGMLIESKTIDIISLNIRIFSKQLLSQE